MMCDRRGKSRGKLVKLQWADVGGFIAYGQVKGWAWKKNFGKVQDFSMN
jgi:hypothetical protein